MPAFRFLRPTRESGRNELETRVPPIDDLIQAWLEKFGLTSSGADLGSQAVLTLAVFVTALTANFIAKRVLATAVQRLAARTQAQWDDVVVAHGVFDRVAQLAPTLILYVASWLILPEWPGLQAGLRHLCVAYMVLVVARAVNGLLDAGSEIYDGLEVSKSRPIKSYLQVVKVVLFSITAVLVISTVTERSPWAFLSGLAGLTAVLLLVFKDSILGLVASIQLTANNMVSVGDWIEMPAYGADGDVIDISLNTVKIQNWDKTISTVPTHALVTHSFRNWRGMSDSGGRRIKRTLYIDMNSVAFCSTEHLARLGRIGLLSPYLKEKQAEIAADHQHRGVDTSVAGNTRRLTNLGTFRAYAEAYLRAHPKIHQDMTLLVRELAPSNEGIGIEVYVFSNDQIWAHYESIQADIFEHFISVLPEFALRPFQGLTGADIQQLQTPAASQ